MHAPRIHHGGARRQAAFGLWLFNLAFGIALGANYLAHVPDVDSPKMWLFALPALVSSVAILTLPPGLFFCLLARWWARPRLLGLVQGAFWCTFQTALFADTRIYNIFKYHFNGQVLNLVYTRGSEDAIHLGWQVWTAVGLGLSLGIAVQLWVWKKALRRAEIDWTFGMRARLLRPGLVFGAILLPALFLEKTLYAQADLRRDREVTQLAHIFPGYLRLPWNDFASMVSDPDREPPPRVELEGVELDYPKNLHGGIPTIDPDGARPNVLVIVIDCLRRDMLTAENTPNIERWSADALRFEDHVSGGNSTRYGLFSLVYGLHGSYWFPFLQERRSPVLIDALLATGYDFGVFSSATMNYPELRDTAWSRIGDSVYDDYGELEPWRRDVLAADDLIEWLEAREDDEDPFFSFILLDSPHQTYSHPPGSQPFTPAAEEVDYLSMTKNEGPSPEELALVRNRYNNAVHHADAVAGRILAAIDAASFGEDTLIVVTGDHGEEFRECGFFGHTSAFTPEQIAVPFLLKGAGIEAGTQTAPTSHLDFAPTLLEMLGADPAQRDCWTVGKNLFDPPADRRRVISGWNELGVWTPRGIVRVPLSLLEFDVELFDYRWRLQPDDLEVLEAERGTLVRLGAECNRFLVTETGK